MERKFGKLRRKVGNEVYETVPFITSQDIFTSETGTKYDGQSLNAVIGDLLNGFLEDRIVQGEGKRSIVMNDIIGSSVLGDDSISAGAGNTINAKKNVFVLGSGNSYVNQYGNGALIGTDNTAVGEHTYIVGFDNEGSEQNQNCMFGEHLKCSSANQTALGKYNAEDDEASFMIGNGTANDMRSNALVIKKTGVVEIPSGVQINNPEGTLTDVATADLTNIENDVFKAKAEEAEVLGLPAYTSENNGEFLKIVNGIPTWVSITTAEEVSY